MNLLDYEEKYATQRVLIVGLSKSGKSTLAATLARKYRLIWIDTENAAETLTKLPQDWKKNIEYIRIPDSSAFPIAAQTIQRLFKEKKAAICYDHGTINCPVCKKAGKTLQEVDLTNLDPTKDVVVLDSLTQVGMSFLAHILRMEAIDYKPVLDDWGGLRKNTEFLSSNIQAVNFNLVCTALTVESELEDGRIILVPQFGSKGSSASIAAKFSTVIFCEGKNKKHKAYSSSTASNLFLSGARAGYEIEKQTGDPDLVPMFDQLVARVSQEAKPEPRLGEAVEVTTGIIPPITTIQKQDLLTKSQEAKSSLLRTKSLFKK